MIHVSPCVSLAQRAGKICVHQDDARHKVLDLRSFLSNADSLSFVYRWTPEERQAALKDKVVPPPQPQSVAALEDTYPLYELGGAQGSTDSVALACLPAEAVQIADDAKKRLLVLARLCRAPGCLDRGLGVPIAETGLALRVLRELEAF